MIADNILGNINNKDFNNELNKKIDYVMLDWFELDKKLLRKTTLDGEEIGIKLNGEHKHFHEGDILFEDENKIIAIGILETDLTVIYVKNIVEMGRLCFEIGNRHLSLAIKEDSVSIPYDEPTFSYLIKLGFDARKEKGRFSHFTVCHGHGHSHE